MEKLKLCDNFGTNGICVKKTSEGFAEFGVFVALA
jgi:hypothetical protein